MKASAAAQCAKCPSLLPSEAPSVRQALCSHYPQFGVLKFVVQLLPGDHSQSRVLTPQVSVQERAQPVSGK